MSFSSIQPHFSVPIDSANTEVLKRVKYSVENNAELYEGQFTSDHVLISFHKKKRHFWSPWLHLEIRDKETSPLVYGWFTPHPSVWTGFVFSYLVVGCLASLSLITGLTQQLLKQNAWGYIGIPLMLLIGVLLYFVSRTGQRLAKDEMDQLQKFATNCVLNTE